MEKIKVVFDPGHGKDKPGAVVDPDPDVQGDEAVEKDINLDVVLAAGRLLREKGHDVLYTRDRDIDVSLSQRRDMINKFKPDAFISIHCNASEEHRSRGIESFYRDETDYSLAFAIQKTLCQMTGLRDRGVFRDVEDLHKRLTVLDDSENIPATLVELGFLDDTGDREYIMNNKETIAEIIADAVDGWARERGKA